MTQYCADMLGISLDAFDKARQAFMNNLQDCMYHDFALVAAGLVIRTAYLNQQHERLLALEGCTSSCALCEEKARRIEKLEKAMKEILHSGQKFDIYKIAKNALSVLDERGEAGKP